MKKIISILAVLILTFSLVACNNNKTNENNNSNNQIENVQNEDTSNENVSNEEINNVEQKEVLDENDIATFYTIDEGMNVYSESLTIRLYENTTKGYSWQYTEENDEKVVKVEDKGIENEQELNSEHVFKITGVSKGEKYVTFENKAASDSSDTFRYFTFVFDVNENNEIALSVTGV